MPWAFWAALDLGLFFLLFILWQMYDGGAVIRRSVLRRHPRAVAVISIDGVLSYGVNEQNNFSFVQAALREIFWLRPKGLIVRVNSPGGTVAASQELSFLLAKIGGGGTKVVALLEDVAASGGLYVALAAERIVAHPGTVTGSIGVIMQNVEYSALLDRFQVRVNTIKSGEFKDILSPTRRMEDHERRILQQTVMNVHDQFCTEVSERRGLSRQEVDRFADGRIFSGHEAKNLGLIDDTGSFDTAVQTVCSLAGFSSEAVCLVPYRPKRGLFGGRIRMLFSKADRLLPNAELHGIPLWLMPRF